MTDATTEGPSGLVRQHVDIVFEGGGARGLALNGAMVELEKRGYSIGRLVGTSAGSITATLVAVGYRGDELWNVGRERLPSGASRMTDFLRVPSGFTEEELQRSLFGAGMLHPTAIEWIGRRLELAAVRGLLHLAPFAKLFSFAERGGLYSADGFVAWLAERLDANGRAASHLTLTQLFAKTGVDLTLVASDTTARGYLVLNHRTAPELPILSAVRMSMSIPFLWPEVIWAKEWGAYCGTRIDGHAIVDGGVVSNLGLRFLVSDEPWIERVMGRMPDPLDHVLALVLDGSKPVPGADIVGGERGERALPVFERIERVFETALEANDNAEEAAYEPVVCRLPTKGFGTLEFGMTDEQVVTLMRGGAAALDAWLRPRADRPHTVGEVRLLRRGLYGSQRGAVPMT